MNTEIDNDVVRQQAFDCDGPAELDITLGPGMVEIRLAEFQLAEPPASSYTEPDAGMPTGMDTGSDTGSDTAPDTRSDTADAEPASVVNAEPGTRSNGRSGAGSTVHVEVRHAKNAGNSMAAGLTGLLSWVGGRFGSWGEDLPAEAVRETLIGKQGNRVEVRGPKTMPLSAVPLAVTVTAPAGSAVNVRVGSADVRISGVAGRCAVHAGSGEVSLDGADGPVHVQLGSGSARLGTIGGDLSARSGSGDLEIAALNASSTISTGSGDVWVGIVRGSQLSVKTGSGDLTVADAQSGDLELTTGSGDLRLGVHSGVLAELDLTTGSGRARSDLEVNNGPAPDDTDAVVRVRGRTGSGDAVVTRATA